MSRSKNDKIRRQGQNIKKQLKKKNAAPKTSKEELNLKAKNLITNKETGKPYVNMSDDYWRERQERGRLGLNPSTGQGYISPISKSQWEDSRGFFGNLNDFLGTTNSRNDPNAPLYKKMIDNTLWTLDSNNPSGGLQGVFNNPAVQTSTLAAGGYRLLPLIPSVLTNNITTPFTGKSIGQHLGDALPVLTGTSGDVLTTSLLYPSIQYKGRVALYNQKNPFGYANNIGGKFTGIKPVKSELRNVVFDFLNPLSIKPKNTPYWLKVMTSPDNSVKPMTSMPAGAAAEFRNMMYRKALRFKNPKGGTIFVKNSDGTYSVDMNKLNTIRQKYGGNNYESHIYQMSEPQAFEEPVYHTRFTTVDDLAGVGGGAFGVLAYNPETGGIKGIIQDTWDLQPFKDSRSIWKWGSKNIPGLNNIEVLKLMGGKTPTTRFVIDNPKVIPHYQVNKIPQPIIPNNKL